MNKYKLREQKLLNELIIKTKMSTQDVSELLGISESSTRRLFALLESEGKIIRVYGGIQLLGNNDSLGDYSFNAVEKMNYRQKHAIAIKACEYIHDDDVLYLDCGTTTFQMAVHLANLLDGGKLKNIRVITNSLVNLETLYKHCQVILVGGIYNSNRKDFAGYSAELFIKQFNYKKAFLGADGFVPGEGFMASDDSIARLNMIAIEKSDEAYVLMDSSKIGKFSYAKYASFNEINAVITDWRLTDMKKKELEQADVSVIVCESAGDL